MTNSTNFYYKGFELAFDNALRLKKIADLSYREGEFGIACSLNILAAEEIVKANFILIKHYNPNINIVDFKEIFRKHPVKHNHLKGIAAVHFVFNEQLKKDWEIFENFLLIIDKIPEQKKEKILREFSMWHEIRESIQKFDDRKINFEKIIKWADKANNDKNNGFYVDIKKNKWASPKSFTKEKYLEESKYTESIIEFVKDAQKIFSDVKTIINKTPLS